MVAGVFSLFRVNLLKTFLNNIYFRILHFIVVKCKCNENHKLQKDKSSRVGLC